MALVALVLMTGCATVKTAQVKPKLEIMGVEVENGFTVVRLNDNRYLRLTDKLRFSISEKHPNGNLYYRNTDTGEYITEMPHDLVRCNKEQIVDCYISEKERKAKMDKLIAENPKAFEKWVKELK